MELGRIGIWTWAFEGQPAARVGEVAAELEELGYGALWFGETLGREAITQAALLLAATRRIVVATGIANVSYRTPLALAAAHRTLSEAYPGRFLLGLGGHRATNQAPMPVIDLLPALDGKPLAAMRAYLDALDAAPVQIPEAAQPPRRVLAALGPRMLELAAERSAGAHTYFVPVEHTVQARALLGAGPLLAVEQAVVLGRDTALAREHVTGYLHATHYANNLRRLGFQDAGQPAVSDRTVDAIVATGDVDAITRRVREQIDAGADHVCIQVLPATPGELPLAEWRELAQALKEFR
jgi:probable F420-dependent oxidoreductase